MLTVLLALGLAVQDTPPSPAVEQIVDRMVRADESRAAALGGYPGMRRYRFENKPSCTVTTRTGGSDCPC